MCNNTTCVYWYSYGDGSLTTGDFVYDTITMDGINGQKQQVNSQTFSQNLLSISCLQLEETKPNKNISVSWV
jgi:hypothetical protein